MLLPFKIDETGYEAKWTPFASIALCLGYLAFGGAAFGALPESSLESMAYDYGYVPLDFKWWAPLTCTFIHGHWEHLLGNLCFFWIYGSAMERLIGLPRFLLIYAIGAYASVLAHGLSMPSWLQDVPAIGASGAISAVLGAFLVFLPNVRIQFLVFSPIYSRPLPSSGPAHFVIGTWFLVQIFFGLKMLGDVGQIAFWAHIAGFGAGALTAWAMLFIGRLASKRNEAEETELGHIEEAFRLWRAGEGELAVREAVAALVAAREARESGALLQAYSWLAFDPARSALAPAWIHREAIFPALRLKLPELALHALAKAAEAGAIEDPKKALASFKAALEKSGRDGLAQEAGAVLSSL